MRWCAILSSKVFCLPSRDESGIWWFIGCRGFNISGTAPKWNFKYFLAEALLFVPDDSDEDGDSPSKNKM